jgi:tetratricopeptide (TPR) repeat protein
MKLRLIPLSAALFLALQPPASGQNQNMSPPPDQDQTQSERDLEAQQQSDRDRSAQEQPAADKETPPAPNLDPKRIINESYSFLKEREPEMTEEEDALYQRVVLLVPTQPDFAMQLLENMMTGDQPVSPAFDFALANIYFNNGRRDDAETHYKTAIKKYPDFLRAWTNLGILYYSTQRYTEATTALAKSVSLGDRDAGTVGLMGYCLDREGDPVAAEMAYLQALALAPENTDWLQGLIAIYQESKQYARAEPLAKRLIQLKPQESTNWLLYANLLLSQGEKVKAVAVLETAASISTIDEDGLLLLGDLYAEQRFYPEATATYEKAMARDPKLGAKRAATYAQGLISEGRYDQADAILKSMEASLTPGSRTIWLETKIDLLAAREQWPEARTYIAELLKLDPLNGKALLRLGQIYRLQGDVARATFTFEQAYRLPGTAYPACLELSNLSLQSHNYDKSIEYIEKALTLQKSGALQDYLIKLKTLVPDHENNAQLQ